MSMDRLEMDGSVSEGKPGRLTLGRANSNDGSGMLMSNERLGILGSDRLGRPGSDKLGKSHTIL